MNVDVPAEMQRQITVTHRWCRKRKKHNRFRPTCVDDSKGAQWKDKCRWFWRCSWIHSNVQKMLMYSPSWAAVGWSRVRRCEREGSDVQEAREDPGRKDREASETFSRSRYTAFSRRRRRKEAFTEGPNEVATEFKDVGTPACTRETERLLQHAWMATAQQFKRRRWDTGGLTANNNHAGGVEGLRNHAVAESQRPESEKGSDRKPRCCKVPRP